MHSAVTDYIVKRLYYNVKNYTANRLDKQENFERRNFGADTHIINLQANLVLLAEVGNEKYPGNMLVTQDKVQEYNILGFRACSADNAPAKPFKRKSFVIMG